MQVLLPALLSSIPILLHRIASDLKDVLTQGVNKLLPQSNAWRESAADFWDDHMAASLRVPESLLKHFDMNNDGILSRDELLNVTDWLQRAASQRPTFWKWFANEWPLMDWKVGLFLWHSFGGMLVLLTLLSIVPGRLHGYAARILRWPILGLTYFLVAVELVVYGVIRLAVRLAEFLIARPKHRALRRQMMQATSYAEWYAYASQLDRSQKRNTWLKNLDHDHQRYNWTFIKELIVDLKAAREAGDSLWAMAVLENCTRKNVGGIMSEDLFSYSNTGIPKFIVSEFIEEVTQTLHWMTDEAASLPVAIGLGEQTASLEQYEQTLKTEVRKEKDKLWRHLVSIFDNKSDEGSDDGESVDKINQKDYFKEKKKLEKKVEQQKTGTLQITSSREEEEELQSQARRTAAHALPSVHREQVMQLLRRARTSYGRTALCLSGGAMMGLYHCGHIRALLETGCLPNIVSGTSAGSVIGAILCTRTDEELVNDLRPEAIYKYMTCFARPWLERIKSVWKTGNMFDQEDWNQLIKWFTNGDMTFEEAYQKTGRVFCITLSSTSKKAPPVLLNHLSAPNVVIASAVIASAAVPGFIPPVRLRYKDSKGNIRYYGKGGESYYDGSIRSDIPTSGLAEMLNVQFFIVCQCNPHIVPFFYNSKGKVGRPSRWSSGQQEHSWRGGFLLAALEMYLKNDMRAKFVFLDDLEAAVGFTAQLFTQGFVGSTTIVPQVSFWDYFWLFADPLLHHLYRYFQAGSVAAYEHISMIKLHYKMADALDECIVKLSGGKVAMHERSTVHFKPLRSTDSSSTPPPISMEDVSNVVPRVSRNVESGSGGRSFESLSTDDYDDDDNWTDL